MSRLGSFIILAVAGSLAASVAWAQDDDVPEPDAPSGSVEEGMDLLGQGLDLMMRGLAEEIGPELRRITPELRAFAERMGPMLDQLSDLMGDVSAYHAPERLPNGDILIRRKTPDEMDRMPEDQRDDEAIDL